MAYVSRNIPAHAGKTPGRVEWAYSSAEHPRARGENVIPTSERPELMGTSPRTRGKRSSALVDLLSPRNIPAHAGKTPLRGERVCENEEHPRARGENAVDSVESGGTRGTSPRTRGKQVFHRGTTHCERNIPAHAGKTR